MNLSHNCCGHFKEKKETSEMETMANSTVDFKLSSPTLFNRTTLYGSVTDDGDRVENMSASAEVGVTLGVVLVVFLVIAIAILVCLRKRGWVLPCADTTQPPPKPNPDYSPVHRSTQSPAGDLSVSMVAESPADHSVTASPDVSSQHLLLSPAENRAKPSPEGSRSEESRPPVAPRPKSTLSDDSEQSSRYQADPTTPQKTPKPGVPQGATAAVAAESSPSPPGQPRPQGLELEDSADQRGQGQSQSLCQAYGDGEEDNGDNKEAIYMELLDEPPVGQKEGVSARLTQSDKTSHVKDLPPSRQIKKKDPEYENTKRGGPAEPQYQNTKKWQS